ncbi:MAG: hypothetical protein ACKO1N_04870 [Erythrobacter sp.]
MTALLIRYHRPERPSLLGYAVQDFRRSTWREGACMILPFAFIWLAMWGSAGL